MSQYVEKIDKLTLPVLPVRGTVAFPSTIHHFEVTDPSDLQVIQAAADQKSPVLLLTELPNEAELPEVVASQHPMEELLKELQVAFSDDDFSEESDESDLSEKESFLPSVDPAHYATVGTVGLLKHLAHSDEHTRVTIEGTARASVIRLFLNGNILTAEVMVKAIMLQDVDEIRARSYLHTLTTQLHRLFRLMPGPTQQLAATASAIKNPAQLADFIATNILFRPEDKLAVLCEFDPLRRIEILLALMASMEEMLQCEVGIHKKVRENLQKNQKEYYLREQLRVIHDELGDGAAAETERYEDMILSTPLPDDVQEKLLRENDRLSRTPFGSQEAGMMTTYLDAVLALPWGKYSKERLNVAAAKKILDDDHYGLEKVKERILEYLAVKQLHPKLKNQVICLVGAPGVGKTSIAASIARAMKREYVRVSLGGIRDESDIRGHRRTYLGSMPGRIMTALTQAGKSNPLILLDEIDKMTQSIQGDPAAALLEVLDGEQNRAFRDHYLEIPYDLSDCLFVATANTLETVPRPLIDRMEIIEVKSYTKTEKLNIAKQHLLPKQLHRHGLNKNKVRISDDAMVELIDYYTREAGVRQLERTLASLIRKAARKMVEEDCKSVSIKACDIKGYLGERKRLPDHIDTADEVGTVNGLAYTELGGDMLRIEAAVLDGTGKLELTGSLGDVMKESARTAITYTRSIAEEYGIDRDFYQKKDIHIHVPEGAVPKDGPSAGVTMLTALVSALTGRPVRREIAMTGEITLRGRVLPIGGLREKTMAAYSAGVQTVLIPADNQQDLEDIDAVARENLTFIPVSHASDVLKNALL